MSCFQNGMSFRRRSDRKIVPLLLDDGRPQNPNDPNACSLRYLFVFYFAWSSSGTALICKCRRVDAEQPLSSSAGLDRPDVLVLTPPGLVCRRLFSQS